MLPSSLKVRDDEMRHITAITVPHHDGSAWLYRARVVRHIRGVGIYSQMISAIGFSHD